MGVYCLHTRFVFVRLYFFVSISVVTEEAKGKAIHSLNDVDGREFVDALCQGEHLHNIRSNDVDVRKQLIECRCDLPNQNSVSNSIILRLSLLRAGKKNIHGVKSTNLHTHQCKDLPKGLLEG
jgi:hypothetical protein